MSTVIAKNVQIGTSGTSTDNFTIFQPATPDGTLRIGNGNTGITTSQVALTSAGNVGIGINAPTLNTNGTVLHINNSTASRAAILHCTNAESGSTGADGLVVGKWSDGTNYFFDYDSNPIVFGVNSAEAMRIDTSRNVGIGTSSPSNRLQVAVGSADVARFTNTQSNGGDWQFKIGGGGFEDRRLMITDRFSGADNVRVGIDSSGNFQFNSGYGSAATAYGCRAWVNFNGTGTVAIRASGNVTSITDNGTGNYTVNFTTAMPDVNYSVVCGNGNNGVSNAGFGNVTNISSTTSVPVVHYENNALVDIAQAFVVVFR